MKPLTAKEPKEKLKDIPDDLELILSSDSGVDQDPEGEIVITDAFQCGDTFDIYCNVDMDADEEEGFEDEN